MGIVQHFLIVMQLSIWFGKCNLSLLFYCQVNTAFDSESVPLIIILLSVYLLEIYDYYIWSAAEQYTVYLQISK